MIKKLSKVSLFVMAAFVFAFTACSNLTDSSATVSGGESSNDACTLTLSYSDGSNGSARTIMPDEWDSTKLFFKLTGSANNGATVSKELGYFASGSDAGKITLSHSIWELTLTAYSDNAYTKPVLVGYAYADLTNSSTVSISFTLASRDLTTAGKIKVTGTYKDEEGRAASMTIGIYNLGTYAEIDTSDGDMDTDEKSFKYENDDVAPGTYNFLIKFKDSAGKIIGEYPDTVIVDAGNTSTKEYTDINVINGSPAAPSELMAFLVKDSEANGYYNVRFTWKDNSDNEENFILTITDAEDNSTYKIYGVEKDDDAKKEIFYTSADRVSGSLMVGNKECVIKLPTGRIFEASIQASNSIGASTAAVREDSTGSTSTTYTGYAKAATGNTSHINRVQITYNLNGGTLLAGGKTYSGTYYEYKTYPTDYTSGANSDAVVLYGYNYDNSASEYTNTLAASSKNSTATTYLREGSYPFKNWMYNDDTTEVNNTKDYATKKSTKAYDNVVVKANYNDAYVINYTIQGYSDLSANADITAKATTVDGQTEKDYANSTIVLGRLENVDVTIAVTAKDTATVTYTEYKITVDGESVVYSGTASSYAYNTEKLTSGRHTIMVSAKDSTGQWYSYTFGLKVSR